MANEITLVTNVRAIKGKMDLRREVQQAIGMSGNNFDWHTQSVPTTAGATAMPIAAAVATYGVAYFRNLDGANYVDIGVKPAGTFVPVFRLKPGEMFPVRLSPGVALYGLANTAAVNVEVAVIED